MKPILTDTTLRDGEQAPGVVFSLPEKIEIASLLDQIGITQVETGTPAIGEKEEENIRVIAALGFSFIDYCWSRARKEDILKAARTLSKGINISFPVSLVQLEALGKNYHWITNELEEIIKIASDHFEHVALGAQDASRAEVSFLHEYAAIALSHGVKRLRIADTVGILNPSTTFELISNLKNKIPGLPLEFHGHNDLGMATANTMMAAMAGAEYLNTTVNGLGERAGNAPLEEVAMAFKYSENMQLDVNYPLIEKLCTSVSRASNRPTCISKPITGEMVYCHESGIHTNSILKNIKTYQVIDPSEVGIKQKEFIFGKHSGKASVLNYFKKRGIHLNQEEVNDILHDIKRYSTLNKKSLDENDLLLVWMKRSMCLKTKTYD